MCYINERDMNTELEFVETNCSKNEGAYQLQTIVSVCIIILVVFCAFRFQIGYANTIGD
jgi:hypothetical protein